MANCREEILALEIKARAGDLDAKHMLGMAYRRGDGVAQDKAKGAALIIEAAEGGCKPALSSVGVCYYFGDGVPKNHRLAMKWYQAAAKAGIWEGFFNVADLFDDSDEIAKNPVEALAWFTSSLGVMPHAADRMQAIVGTLSEAGLAWLASVEEDAQTRGAYRKGLAVTAQFASPAVATHAQFDNADRKVFGNADWRQVYDQWFPQPTQKDAERLAGIANQQKRGLRKSYEAAWMRNPLAAAAVVALAGDPEDRAAVLQAVGHYDYARLNMAEFFFAEVAYYALPELK